MKTKLASLVVATLVGLVLTVLLFWKGVPLLLRGVVRMVPVSWEEALGRTVKESIGRGMRECSNPELLEAVEQIQTRLESGLGKQPYRFRIQVVNHPEVNALAAPGGYVVLFRGLVERMDSPEQLAGIVAHEMQHVVQRHSTNSMVRAMGMQVIFTLVFGDAGGLTGLAGGLGLLHFMRSDEQQADEEGMDTLARAGIAPEAMITAFRKLEAAYEGKGEQWKYLSTHPPMSERIGYLERRASQWTGKTKPLADGLSLACEAAK
ncbi:MAG: M48 family metallopeptidase [Bryobacter sp.]|nr:M48 family metallopeptidase [Bryobacter sp.]